METLCPQEEAGGGQGSVHRGPILSFHALLGRVGLWAEEGLLVSGLRVEDSSPGRAVLL